VGPAPSRPAALRLASRIEVTDRVEALAGQLDLQHPDGCLLVGVLRGAVMFLADLMRAMNSPVEIDFMGLRPFTAGGPAARLTHDLSGPVAGRPVVLVDDLVDTGLSARWLVDQVRARGAATVTVCSLVDRRAGRLVPFEPDLVGFVVDDETVIGSGLDHAGRYRNVPGLWAVDPAALAAEPDAYLMDLFAADQPAGPVRRAPGGKG
jgi:hypoxanthine phosphoribosyltransferase